MEEIIYIISKIGYDGIEIWGYHLKKYEASLSRLRKLLNYRNLEVPMISPYFDFTGRYQNWCRSIEEGKKFISFAVELNCPLIRCFTGKVSSEFATEKQWKACIEGIKYLAEIAKKNNITLAIETHLNTLADKDDSIMRLLTEINTDNVKLNLDFYNLYEISPDNFSPKKLIEKFYPYIVHIHAKNAILSKGKISPFWYVMDKKVSLENIRYLSAGDLDYNSIIKMLIDKNYQGYISIECFETRRNPIRVAEDELKYIRSLNK
ncbi:MAG: sugar phosphate isomerase/epimerase family protein [Nitrososphaeria archaeon]